MKPWAGKYNGSIIATAGACPQLKDTIRIDFSSAQQQLNLGADHVFCPGENYRLSAGPQFRTYQWQDGSHDSIFIAGEPGVYSVIVSDGCSSYSDTIRLYPPGIMLNAGTDTALCRFSSLQLQASNGFETYNWQSSVSGEQWQGNNIIIQIKESSVFIVTASFQNCSVRDSVIVTVKQCGERLFVPTAFTPNNDGLNDRFSAYVDGALGSYRLNVFNRWGEVVFSTTDQRRSWDGYWKNKQQPAGVYIWQCEYQFNGSVKKIEKGTVALIR